MKATRAGPIVGKALEAYDNPNPNAVGKIMTFINVSWYDPQIFLTDTGDLNIIRMNPNESEYSLVNAAGEVIDRVGAFAEVVVAQLRAGLIETQELITNSLTVKEKLISPLVETQEIKTERISLQEIEAEPGEDLVFNLQEATESGFGPSTSSGFGKLIVKGKEGKEVVSIDAEGNARFAGDLEARRASFAGELHAKKIVAEEIVGLKGKFGELITATVSAEKIQGLEQRLAQLEASPSPSPSPTPTLSPEPSPPATESSETDALADVELSPDIKALVNEILNTSLEATPQADLADVSGDNLNIANNLTVLGSTSLADTSIAGSLNIGGTMSLADNSINTLTGPLYLQNLGLGGIDILAGKVVIDEQGNAVFEGDITIKGRLALSEIEPLPEQDIVVNLVNQVDQVNQESKFGNLLVKGVDDEIVASIEASGTATFKKLAIAKAEEKVTQISETEIETNATAGQATLPANEAEITIKSQFVKENTLIYVTPISDTQNKVLFVKAKKATAEQEPGWFKVAIDSPIGQDIEFNWWIIN